MGLKLTDLAARIKEAVVEEDHARARAEENAKTRAEQEERRRAQMVAARRDLLDELKAFAKEIGGLDVSADKTSLTLARGDRTLRFDGESPDGSIDVLWSGATDDECVTWDDRSTWIWVHDEHELPFVEAGLEDLLVEALGLPRPESVEGVKRPKAKRTTASYRKQGLVNEITLEHSAPAPSAVARSGGAKARASEPPAEKPAVAPPEPELAMVGRSGTRGFKREHNVTPGSGRKGGKKGIFD